ncbi:YwqG family protein [Sporosarcina obsidiansis]|uniref:YwqG family protein n=1 Tax=Sporosarcina obsidiansis TaxID=2660748 RepID=UPI001890CDEA|nr:YwqG family protein [Sporosarcina obsidiansis]
MELDQQMKDLLPKEWQEKLLESQKDTVEFSFKSEGELPLIATKAGGIGYIPKRLAYPVNSKGQPLSLLAQINFSEIPKMDPFPTQGILAFYVDYYDDLIGADFGDNGSADGYRVLYFDSTEEESYTREEQVMKFLPYQEEETFLVVDTELRMIPRLTKQPLFTDIVEFKQVYGMTKDEIEVFDPYADELDELLDFGTRLGGYPNFTQTDPRVYEKEETHDVLLFQLDTDYDMDGGWEIMWGDSGVGNFFISRQDLKDNKFENAWYTWDCM